MSPGFDDVHRYLPSVLRTCVGNRAVVRSIAHPPGTHPAHCPIRADLWCVEAQTDGGGSRWFGCERAYIASDLCMVVVGHPERDEVRARWKLVPEQLRVHA